VEEIGNLGLPAVRGSAEPVAGVLRRESAWPVFKDVTKCGIYYSIHLRAILFRSGFAFEGVILRARRLSGSKDLNLKCCRHRPS